MDPSKNEIKENEPKTYERNFWRSLRFGFYWRPLYRKLKLYFVDIDAVIFHKGNFKFFLEIKDAKKDDFISNNIKIGSTQLHVLNSLSKKYEAPSYIGMMHDEKTWLSPEKYREFVKLIKPYFKPAKDPLFKIYQTSSDYKGGLKFIGDFDKYTFPRFVIDHPKSRLF